VLESVLSLLTNAHLVAKPDVPPPVADADKLFEDLLRCELDSGQEPITKNTQVHLGKYIYKIHRKDYGQISLASFTHRQGFGKLTEDELRQLMRGLQDESRRSVMFLDLNNHDIDASMMREMAAPLTKLKCLKFLILDCTYSPAHGTVLLSPLCRFALGFSPCCRCYPRRARFYFVCVLFWGMHHALWGLYFYTLQGPSDAACLQRLCRTSLSFVNWFSLVIIVNVFHCVCKLIFCKRNVCIEILNKTCVMYHSSVLF
jgi:hypothetical protein